MSAERLAVPLAGLLLVALLPAAALAQSPTDQVQEAAAQAEDLARDNSEPSRAVANATNASWQAEQVAWTETWTCGTAYAVDERVGEAAGEALGCRLPSEEAGPTDEREAEEDAARAEEAEADAERAARDQAAASEALARSVAEEPEQTPSHAETFLARTLAFANATLAVVEDLLALPVDGLRWAGQGLLKVGLDLAAGVASAGQAGAEGVHRLAGAAERGAQATADGLAGVADTTRTSIAAGWQEIAAALDGTEADAKRGEATPVADEAPAEIPSGIEDAVRELEQAGS